MILKPDKDSGRAWVLVLDNEFHMQSDITPIYFSIWIISIRVRTVIRLITSKYIYIYD